MESPAKKQSWELIDEARIIAGWLERPPPGPERMAELYAIIDECDRADIKNRRDRAAGKIGKYRYEANHERIERVVIATKAVIRGWEP